MTGLRLIARLCVCVGLSSQLVASVAAQEVRYHVTPLGVVQGPRSQGFDINDGGQVVGQDWYANGLGKALRWEPDGRISQLGGFPGMPVATTGFAINERGHVTGVGYSLNGQEGFFWSPPTGLIGVGDIPGGIFNSVAHGMNNLDQVVGYSNHWYGGFNVQEAFVWSLETGMVPLGELPGAGYVSIAYDINDAGQVVGWSDSYRGSEAFLWSRESGMIGLGALEPGLIQSQAYAINERGQVVGVSVRNAYYAANEAFLWSPGEGMIGLGQLYEGPNRATVAYDINDRGEVVGYARRGWTNMVIAAMIWNRERGMRNLNELLDASAVYPYNWYSVAEGINNRGQVVATARWANRAVLLTPFILGDMNCDGVVNVFDIEPFVLGLIDLEAHAQRYPDCHGDWAGDINQDGRFDNFDIDPFVELLLGP